MNSTPLQRALSSAPERASVQGAQTEQELFCFSVGALSFAVESSHVREVLRMGALTPLPRTPSYILGVLGHRGEVLPVLDVLRFLGKGEGAVSSRSRLFVVTHEANVACVLADAVIGLQRVKTTDILPAPMGGEGVGEHLSGLVRGAWSSAVVNVLDIPKVLTNARARLVKR